MNNYSSDSAFVLTSDEPLAVQKLKRLSLVHNRILFSDISDEAIVNEGEVIERFPGITVGWSARGHYPRVGDYEERYYRSLVGAENFLNRRIIQPLVTKQVKTIDPAMHWMCYSAALSDEGLIRAAAVDATSEKPGIVVPNTVVSGLEIAPAGMKSKYSVEYKSACRIQGVHEDWECIAKLRMGRALKSIRIAQAIGACPIATDAVNSQIVLSLIQKNFPFSFLDKDIINFSVESEVVDNEILEGILLHASWDDIVKMRKEILPSIARTKDHLARRTSIISRSGIDKAEIYIAEIKKMKDEIAGLKEQEAKSWEALRIGSILKTGGTVGLVGLGSLALPALASLPNMLVALVSAGLIGASAMGQELQELIQARSKHREHPLFLIERLQGK